jgi:hypothetical protein
MYHFLFRPFGFGVVLMVAGSWQMQRLLGQKGGLKISFLVIAGLLWYLKLILQTRYCRNVLDDFRISEKGLKPSFWGTVDSLQAGTVGTVLQLYRTRLPGTESLTHPS